MENSYNDLIKQTFDFPTVEFKVEENELQFHGIPLMDIIEQYGTPLKLTYLPKIAEQIQKAKTLFNVAMAKCDYKGKYTYCYCTKSSHFSFVLEEVLKNEAHIETSSAYDTYIVDDLYRKGHITKDHYIICNGFKRTLYLQQVSKMVNNGFHNLIPVLDNKNELDYYKKHITKGCNLAIRIASEEEPTFDFYTSRLGIRYIDIIDYYNNEIRGSKFQLKMLHFFINTGIKDSIHYWSELAKCLNVYYRLKQVCPTLDTLNIGGGLPFKNSMAFEYDYEYMIEQIISQIKKFCVQKNVPEPNIFTEFGSFTVAESGANIYSVLDIKQQNDRELWYMVDNSFITTLPDTWGINQRFILLAINHWDREYQRVNLGGLTCDSLDYYNDETHDNQVFLPKFDRKEKLYLGFFNTGAYQESLGGYGGIKHCLIPSPKHVLIDRDENGEYSTKLFAKEQSAKSMLKTLGY